MCSQTTCMRTLEGLVRGIVFILVLMLLACNEGVSGKSGDTAAGHISSETGGASRTDDRMNFVVVLTDDQRWDTLWAMPIVQDKLAGRGVSFTNAFVSTPLCCPMRASFLAGGFYAHNTGVLSNSLPNGGVQKFMDSDALATLLQGSGYQTALIGKYLNDYYKISPYIPPGWTKFVTVDENMYYGYRATRGSSDQSPSSGETGDRNYQYITDFETDEALDFLEQAGNSPFFLFLSTTAPHGGYIPAPQDMDSFSGYLYRDRAYGEPDMSDKPKWIQYVADWFFTPANIPLWDRGMVGQLRTLQAVDRMVGAVVDKIQEMGELNRTVLVFTSDNGYLWGEHRLWQKGKPYEESIRVPLVVVMPGIAPRHDDHLVVSNLDVPTTILNLAGISKETDGLDLVPLLKAPNLAWREEILIEDFFEANTARWAGLRTKTETEEWKYVEYAEGDKELYDLVSDPYEEENKAEDTAYQDVVDEFAARLAPLKGLLITVLQLDRPPVPPRGVVGKKYRFQMEAWGGTQPYSWSIVDGRLPEGLTLDSASGLISGIPSTAETRQVSIIVQDSSVARYTGKPQEHIKPLTFSVDAQAQASFALQNHPPKADAGADQVVNEGQVVALDASRSSALDGLTLYYEWTQTEGTPVILSHPNAVVPVFATPYRSCGAEILTFKLTITDSGGLTDTDTVSVRVLHPGEMLLIPAPAPVKAAAASDPVDTEVKSEKSQ